MSRHFFVIKSDLLLNSPLHIGCGVGKYSDADVIVDSSGRVFLPGSSIAGVLRSMFQKLPDGQKIVDKWFGYSRDGKDETRASKLRFFNAYSEKAKIVIRDAIRIDHKSGLVEDGAKHDRQIVEPGCSFPLRIELEFVKKGQEDVDKAYQLLFSIADALNSNKLFFGAKTLSGYGRFSAGNTELYEFDFSRKEDFLNWLQHKEGRKIKPDVNKSFFKNFRSLAELNISCQIENSLLVRSYSAAPGEPDSVHIKSAGKSVLPGSSLKGAIRQHCNYVLHSIFNNNREKEEAIKKFLNDMFGLWVEHKTAKPGRGFVSVAEVPVENVMEKVQPRVRIDRFTSGAVDSALFDSTPLMPESGKPNVRLQIILHEDKENSGNAVEKARLGLLLLVLKDLFTGRLAVGGEKSVGRGSLIGHSFCFRHQNQFFCGKKPGDKSTKSWFTVDETCCCKKQSEDETVFMKVEKMNEYVTSVRMGVEI
jgi:CRISPR/Cas system CSM-associated protein Csm3 (group 7 of RAMP superfamily)